MSGITLPAPGSEEDLDLAPAVEKFSVGGGNPYYVQYARANQRTTDEQKAYDRAHNPGAAALPFMLWIKSQHRAFCAETKRSDRPKDPAYIAEFTAWLTDRVDHLLADVSASVVTDNGEARSASPARLPGDAWGNR